jgi:hypothetical protein
MDTETIQARLSALRKEKFALEKRIRQLLIASINGGWNRGFGSLVAGEKRRIGEIKVELTALKASAA